MMLADQACQKSPIKKGREGAYSPTTLASATGAGVPHLAAFGDTSEGMEALLQFGSYFGGGSPFPATHGKVFISRPHCPLRQLT